MQDARITRVDGMTLSTMSQLERLPGGGSGQAAACRAQVCTCCAGVAERANAAILQGQSCAHLVGLPALCYRTLVISSSLRCSRRRPAPQSP